MAHDASWLKDHIRDIPDFPKPGVVFKAITPLLADVDAFRFAIDAIADHFAGGGEIHKVLGVEPAASSSPRRWPIGSVPASSRCARPGSCPGRSSGRNTSSS